MILERAKKMDEKTVKKLNKHLEDIISFLKEIENEQRSENIETTQNI